MTVLPAEWNIPGVADPLEQGDILLSRNRATREINTLAVVVTADCDISQSKFGSSLICLRISPIQDYVRSTLASKKYRKAIAVETGKVCDLVNKWNVRRDIEAAPLSSTSIVNWIRSSDPESICSDLKVPEEDKVKVASTLSKFKIALQNVEMIHESDNLARLSVLRSHTSGTTVEDCRQSILKQLQGEVLPDDVFLLPDLPQLTIGGGIILLREAIGIPKEAICFRASDATSNSMFLRIGRLEPTFKYAVTQALGFLYSRIGLPEDYERRRDATLASLSSLAWNSQ